MYKILKITEINVDVADKTDVQLRLSSLKIVFIFMSIIFYNKICNFVYFDNGVYYVTYLRTLYFLKLFYTVTLNSCCRFKYC